MNYQRWQEMMKLQDHLIKVLLAASQQDPREFDLEVRIVHVEALLWAEKHKDCVAPTFEQVLRADSYNAGHVDWYSKFPLYVAQMVYGVDPWG